MQEAMPGQYEQWQAQYWQDVRLPPLTTLRGQPEAMPHDMTTHDMQRLPMIAQPPGGGAVMGAHALQPMWHPAMVAPACYPHVAGARQLYGLPPMLYAAPLMHAPSRQPSDMLHVTSALLF